MKNKKPHVLVRIRKRPESKECDEYEVIFMYSDEAKNFKRIADCSPEIQKMADGCGLCFLDDDGAAICFNIENKSMTYIESKLDKVCDISHLVIDHLEVEGDEYDYVIRVLEWVALDINLGCDKPEDEAEYGKLFIKAGRSARINVTFDVAKISDIVFDYFV